MLINQKVPSKGPCPHAIMENINVTIVTILLQNSDVHNALGPDNSTQAQLLQLQIRTPAMIATGPHSAKGGIELKAVIMNGLTLKFPVGAQFSHTTSHNRLYFSHTFSYHHKIFSNYCLHS